MMKLLIKTLCIAILLPCSFSYGQMEQYNFTRELKGITGQWHKVILPNEVFGKVSQELNDIRIFGITKSKDTIEVPYILRLASDKELVKEVAFNTLNTAHNNSGFYFTFEIPTTEAINQIKLNFEQENFEWRVRVEGSQNLADWFTISENDRILSIQNDVTDFQFTTLKFPSSKYRYFRLRIESEQKPDLITASISQEEFTDGIFRNYSIKNLAVNQNKQSKLTEIDVELEMPVPISHLKIKFKDLYDYYRPITINYLIDSVQTENGWRYDYAPLTSGTLNSIEKNEFTFSSKTVQKLKILIHNQDNQPLTFDTLFVQGYEHEILARFTQEASYFLTYGNKDALKPNYDIERFADKVPITLTTLELGNELTIEQKQIYKTEPLFKNKIWLWIIISLIILVLGWSSIKMMSKQ